MSDERLEAVITDGRRIQAIQNTVGGEVQVRIEADAVRESDFEAIREAVKRDIEVEPPEEPSVEGTGFGTVSRKVDEKIYNEEKTLLGRDTEKALWFDPKTGKQIRSRVGKQDHINFDAEDIREMEGQILTHNHPNNSDFPSPQDFNLATSNGLKEMRVITDKKRVTVFPNEEGWKRTYENRRTGRKAPLFVHAAEKDAEIRERFQARIRKREMTAREADKTHGPTLLQELSDELPDIYLRSEDI